MSFNVLATIFDFCHKLVGQKNLHEVRRINMDIKNSLDLAFFPMKNRIRNGYEIK